ncbi:MAG TPA: copper resistance protein B [Gammaproteobacteria bacterium]|nr:copper resistance protein B [Gammaproteobacteria bacterium]
MRHTFLLSACCGLLLVSASAAHAGDKVQMEDNTVFSQVLFNQLEDRFGGNGNTFYWDAQAWVGGDLHKLWLKSEGSRSGGRTKDADVESFYDRAVTAFWDLQMGVRHDFGQAPARNWVAVGMEGLAPYFVDAEATAYIGPGGRSAVRTTFAYELLFTQRLILTPRLEINTYGRDDPMRRIGAGLSDIELGLRLRYEMRREFAPYVGVVYARSYGGTAAYLRLAGENTEEIRLVAGLRLWF